MMTWWQNAERAAGMPGAFHWLIVGFIVATALLSYLQPAERLRIRNSLILFGLAIAGLVAAGAILSTSAGAGTIYLTLRGAALFMLAVAIINVVSVFVFAVVLRSGSPTSSSQSFCSHIPASIYAGLLPRPPSSQR
jgi:hypothetical protein